MDHEISNFCKSWSVHGCDFPCCDCKAEIKAMTDKATRKTFEKRARELSSKLMDQQEQAAMYSEILALLVQSRAEGVEQATSKIETEILRYLTGIECDGSEKDDILKIINGATNGKQ